jgi:CHASE1-domain containing sensor protein
MEALKIIAASWPVAAISVGAVAGMTVAYVVSRLQRAREKREVRADNLARLRQLKVIDGPSGCRGD